MLSLSRLRPLSTLFRPLCTTASPSSTSTTTSTAPYVESRWRRLKRERRKAPKTPNRLPPLDRTKLYSLAEALHHVRTNAWAKFDESVELVFRLNIDPRLASENIRGVYDLPHGTGRQNKVAAFADGVDADRALEAGAEVVGGSELIEELRKDNGKRLKGFRACVSVPHLVGDLASKLGKTLGPKGLLPTLKDGTVGVDVGEIVRRVKEGMAKYRTDKTGNVHLVVGKLSLEEDKLVQNILAATRAIVEARPATVKKKYLKKVFVCSSMGVGVGLQVEDLVKQALRERGEDW